MARLFSLSRSSECCVLKNGVSLCIYPIIAAQLLSTEMYRPIWLKKSLDSETLAVR